MSDVTAKASANYSDADITIITDEYALEPTRETVDALAERLNKTPRSIIAKLSALGVYQKAERVTKRGEPVIMKAIGCSSSECNRSRATIAQQNDQG